MTALVSMLGWGEAQELHEHGLRFSEQLRVTGESLLASWVERIAERSMDWKLVTEALVLCTWWPELKARVSSAGLSSLHQALGQLIERDWGESARIVTLEQQLFCGELPLAVALLDGADARHSPWLARATQAITTGILEATDSEGLPRAQLLSEIRPLFASWTRSLQRLAHASLSVASDNLLAQYSHLTLQLLRLTRWDYSPVLSGGHVSARVVPANVARELNLAMWRTAVRLAGTEAVELARLALGLELDLDSTVAAAGGSTPGATKKRTAGKAASGKLRAKKSAGKLNAAATATLPTEYSETARLASMRSSWDGASAVQVALAFPDRRVDLELNTRRRTLLSGSWQGEVRVDDRLLQPTGDWEEVCWLSDEETDYLELSLPLDDQWKLERQLLLVRSAGSLYLADTIAGERSGRIDYRGRIPLGPTIAGRAASDSREWFLQEREGVSAPRGGANNLALVLPLYLPEWKASASRGELSCDAGEITWSHRGEGVALCAPLWVAADRALLRREFTWRSLTVAENLQPVSADVAVGYRVQFGASQWLLYRTLSRRGSRSVLGQNVLCDFLASRFTSAGKQESLVEIE